MTRKLNKDELEHFYKKRKIVFCGNSGTALKIYLLDDKFIVQNMNPITIDEIVCDTIQEACTIALNCNKSLNQKSEDVLKYMLLNGTYEAKEIDW